MSLSHEVEYWKAVWNIEDFKVRHWFPPKNWLMCQHQDTKEPVNDILPLTFSAKHSLHHAGREVHTGWKTWGPKALKVKLDGKNGCHSRGYMATQIMLLGMVLWDLERLKSQKMTCAYPYIPFYLEETKISDKNVKSILFWCAGIAKANPLMKIGPPKGVKRCLPLATDSKDHEEPPVK